MIESNKNYYISCLFFLFFFIGWAESYRGHHDLQIVALKFLLHIRTNVVLQPRKKPTNLDQPPLR